LKVTFSQDLGDLGGGSSKPVVVQWRWYYHIPTLTLFWCGLVLPLITTRELRRWAAWAVLPLFVPVLVMAGIGLEAMQPVSRSGLDLKFLILFSIAVSLVPRAYRLFSERLSALAGLSAVLILVALGLACWTNRSNVGRVDCLWVFVCGTIAHFAVLLPISYEICRHRRAQSPVRFVGWPLLWTLLTAAAAALVVVAW
jgi:hypothetical protein